MKKQYYIIFAIIAFAALWIYGGRETTDLEGKYYVSFDNGVTERQLTEEEAKFYDELRKEIGSDYVQGVNGAMTMPVPKHTAMMLRYYAFIDATLAGHDDRIYFVDEDGKYAIYVVTPSDENEVFKASDGYSELAKEIYEKLKGASR